jgi:CBS domain-containing protein
MVTDRDIVCKGLAAKSFDAHRATARDVMTSGIHCCREDDDLAEAIHHMEELRVRRLPVIGKDKRSASSASVTSAALRQTISCRDASRAFRPITEWRRHPGASRPSNANGSRRRSWRSGFRRSLQDMDDARALTRNVTRLACSLGNLMQVDVVAGVAAEQVQRLVGVLGVTRSDP